MRIAIGQVWQETNTLNPLPTTREDFEHFGVLRGNEVVERMRGVNEPGGFLAGLQSWPRADDVQPLGVVRLPAWPGGPVTAEAFQWLERELTERLRAVLPVDAVLLALHGAMAAEGQADVEGHLLQLVRRLVGPRIPLVCSLDLHANLTEAMVSNADVLVAYHCAPHIDVYETGLRAAAVLGRLVHRQARPVTAFQKIPVVLPPELADTQADSGVSAELKHRLQEMEQDDRVLSAAVTTVQPWLDVPNLGSAALVATDGEPQLAGRYCSELAELLWRRRREYLPELLSIEQAVQAAFQTPGLVVLSDAADATTSGAPGDSVWLLEQIMRYDWTAPALVTLVAPEVVRLAQEIGAGGQLKTQLGGRRDRRFGKQIEFAGRVGRLFDAAFVLNGHLGKNMPIQMGPSAVLERGALAVIVTSRSGPHFAPELFQAAGYDPFQASLLVAKSPCGFRAVYQQHAAAIYNVRAPGCAPTDFWNYPYQHIDRPLWPWDDIEDWTARPTVFAGRLTP